jgi:hypothetical protein
MVELSLFVIWTLKLILGYLSQIMKASRQNHENRQTEIMGMNRDEIVISIKDSVWTQLMQSEDIQ